MVKKIIAVGPVIVLEGRLLVIQDGKDEFYKIPGGKPLEKESLDDCAHRELMEETGYSCKLLEKLSTMYLNKKPQTGEIINIELHHFKAELLGEINNYKKFNHGSHEVSWLVIDEIRDGKYSIAPNIEFLLDKKEI